MEIGQAEVKDGVEKLGSGQAEAKPGLVDHGGKLDVVWAELEKVKEDVAGLWCERAASEAKLITGLRGT